MMVKSMGELKKILLIKCLKPCFSATSQIKMGK
jgi:hypothetical protein